MAHEVLRLHVRKLLCDQTISHAENVHATHVPTLALLFVERVCPQHHATVSGGKRLLGFELSRHHQLEGSSQDRTDSLVAIETPTARVLKR